MIEETSRNFQILSKMCKNLLCTMHLLSFTTLCPFEFCGELADEMDFNCYSIIESKYLTKFL